MLPNPIPLSKDTATDVDTNLSNYVLKFADADHSEYSVAGITPPDDKSIFVGHTIGKGGEARHVFRLNRTEHDAALVPATLSVYVNIVRPPSAALTNAIVKEEVNKLVDFLIEGGTNANVDAILNGEF
jgi:hypothetical protein